VNEEATMEHVEEGEERPRSAVEDLADSPASRRQFVRMVGGTGAAAALTTFLAACGEAEDPQQISPSNKRERQERDLLASKFGQGDLGIVNYALLLEHLEADYYEKAIDADLFSGKTLEYHKRFGEIEKEHVEALTDTVNQMAGDPIKPVKTKFPLPTRAANLEFAREVENAGASAYLGQAPRIQNRDILSAALTIHTVEARHAAALNMLTGRSITPNGAFAKPRTMVQILKSVKPVLVEDPLAF
jgi:rubrerythrin